MVNDDVANIIVRDPWEPGTTYTITEPEFLEYWTGVVIFN